MRDYGVVIVVDEIDEAVRVMNLLAPEHAELAVRDARALRRVDHHRGRDLHRRAHARAGGRLLRRAQPRAADRRQRALRVAARRGRLRQAHVAHRVSGAALLAQGDDIERLAEVEGLSGHARAVAARTRGTTRS